MKDLGSTGHRKTSSGDKAAILAPYPTAWFRVSDRPFVVEPYRKAENPTGETKDRNRCLTSSVFSFRGLPRPLFGASSAALSVLLLSPPSIL